MHAAFEFEGGQYIVSTVRDIRERKAQEETNRRLRNMYIALSSTNEAILPRAPRKTCSSASARLRPPAAS